MEEEWRDIKGWEGYYQASNLGRIRSVTRIVKSKAGSSKISEGRILKLCKDNRGYSIVTLSKNNIIKTKSVHRLVATLFIDNPLNKSETNHKDGNKRNNIISNLEFVTSSENKKHAFLTGLWKPPLSSLGKFGKDNSHSKRISQYTRDGKYIATYFSGKEAGESILRDPTNIRTAARGGIKTAYGYIWKYVNDDNIKQAI